MKRAWRFFAWLAFVSVSWASLVDCPFAFDLIEGGVDFETGAGEKEFAQHQPPDHNDSLASRREQGAMLGMLEAQAVAPRLVEHFLSVDISIDVPTQTILADSAAPRGPPTL